MRYLVPAVIVYLAVISLVSVIVTVYDKSVSKIKGHRRVSEKTLLLLSALGGSVAMYFTMLTVRHKTKHPKFTVGIPVIIVIQYGLFMFIRNCLR